MSFGGIDTLTEFIVAIVSLLGAVKFLVLPLRRIAAVVEANREVTDAQLRKNGGGSLTDKTERIYHDVFPVDGPSLREMLESISKCQKDMATFVKENSRRIDTIEAQHSEDNT